jgi:hypothetical protein
MLQASKNALSKENSDPGLGGIILEGASGIGKSHFLATLMKDQKREYVCISPSLSFTDKVELLRDAFQNGKVVIADEMNASLWPNKLLNAYLMGKDENDQPANKLGFMLIATQNPPYFKGRSEEDPALRQRCIKLKLDWPVYQAPMDKKDEKVIRTVKDDQAKFFTPAPAVIKHDMVDEKLRSLASSPQKKS